MNAKEKKTRDCTLTILGDSISTFQGYIPAHQDAYYPNLEKVPDMQRVEDTWWFQLTQCRRMRILKNDSYSGSTVCNHTRDKQPPESAFIYRMNLSLSAQGIGGVKPDVIVIFGGTNDSWLDRKIGEVKYTDWTQEELRCVLPAYCQLLDYTMKNNPQAAVYCVFYDVIKPEIIEGMQEAAAHYGATAVRLENIDKSNGHPTRLGMAQIAEQIERALDA